jgi:hypothetical protein
MTSPTPPPARRIELGGAPKLVDPPPRGVAGPTTGAPALGGGARNGHRRAPAAKVTERMKIEAVSLAYGEK